VTFRTLAMTDVVELFESRFYKKTNDNALNTLFELDQTVHCFIRSNGGNGVNG
jgi:hypothetical protein